mmetsp:Transcript_44054/g.102872  ORF Transcript_44054/g.102872 Transcript_44054/m.102872 type:complete len:122 (-) Transcript_44054:994-1359(-)
MPLIRHPLVLRAQIMTASRRSWGSKLLCVCTSNMGELSTACRETSLQVSLRNKFWYQLSSGTSRLQSFVEVAEFQSSLHRDVFIIRAGDPTSVVQKLLGTVSGLRNSRLRCMAVFSAALQL